MLRTRIIAMEGESPARIKVMLVAAVSRALVPVAAHLGAPFARVAPDEKVPVPTVPPLVVALRARVPNAAHILLRAARAGEQQHDSQKQ